MDLLVIGKCDHGFVAFLCYFKVLARDRFDVVDLPCLVKNAADFSDGASFAGFCRGFCNLLKLDQRWKHLRSDDAGKGQHTANKKNTNERNATLRIFHFLLLPIQGDVVTDPARTG